MRTIEQTTRNAADLHWLATLLTGCREIAVDVVKEAIASRDDSNRFFSTWMVAWARRIVIAKALTAVREELAASARGTESRSAKRSAFPPRSWAFDPATSKSDLERALLSIDVFPRAAILLLIFEAVPLPDAAVLLDACPYLVRKAQVAGLRELMINLARMQGWTSTIPEPTAATSELHHA